MCVKDSLYSFDEISPNLEDVERWEESEFKDICGKKDDNNTIFIVGKNEYIDYSGVRYNESLPDHITAIGNNENGTQSVYLKYITFKDSGNISDDSSLKVYAYDKETQENGVWKFGEELESSRGTYEFMRNHSCAQLIAYQKEDKGIIYNKPQKLDLKPAILISTPSTMTK